MTMKSWLPSVLVLALMLAAATVLFGVRHAAAQGFDWIHLFGTSFADEANGVAVDADGNVYVAGTTGGRFDGQSRYGGLQDAYLRKLDADGKEIWIRQFGSIGDDEALSVAVDHSGGTLVAGVAAEDIPGEMRVSGFGGAFVRKVDPEGNELWMRHFGISQFSQANGVAVDQDDNVFITGQIAGALPGQTGFGSNDGFLRAYDKNGEELWTRQFGTDGGDFVSGIAVDGDGAVYVAGSTEGGGEFQGPSSRTAIKPFIRKFDGSGSEVWSLRIPSSGFAKATAVAVDDGGRLYVAGWVSGSINGQRQTGRTDAFLIHYNGDGEELWSRQFGTLNEDRALGVGVDTDGNPYAVGWTRGVFPGQTGLEPRTTLERQDAFISRYDRLGNDLWT